jgi:hypothetical protein
MVRKNITYFLGAIAVTILLAFSNKALAATHNQFVFPAGDTSSLATDKSNGWSRLSCYLNQDTPDSVDFEFILILDQTKGRMGGSSEKLIGTISNSNFRPQKDQKITYSLLPDNTWYIIIKTDGRCLLAQTKGSGVKQSALPGTPDLIPVKVKYKNN